MTRGLGLRAALERWLAPENFGADGRQRMALDRFRLPRPEAVQPG